MVIANGDARHPDWPDEHRPIDRTLDDLPHDSSGLEWWYLNFHFTATDGHDYSAFIAFFRNTALDAGKAGEPFLHAHSYNWSLVDVARGAYFPDSAMDRKTVDLLGGMLRNDDVVDPNVRRALLHVLDKSAPPAPDQLIRGDVVVSDERLALRYGELASLWADDAGGYRVSASTAEGECAIDFRLLPVKEPIRHGRDGVVAGSYENDDDGMFYYFIPRGELSGTFTVDGVTKTIAEGTGWYDHEFGGCPRRTDEGLGATETVWTWAGLQLDNGWDLSFYTLSDVDVHSGADAVRDMLAVAVDPAGERVQIPSYSIEGSGEWTSLRTFNSYPTRWVVSAPAAGIRLTLTAAFAQQELRTITAGRGFWEGRVLVEGSMAGEPVRGVGFVELVTAQLVTDFEAYLGRAGQETRREIRKLYPDRMDEQAALAFIGSRDRDLLQGLPIDELHETLVAPVRHLVDQGGKYWRSYVLPTVVELLGGDSDSYRALMAGAELLHAGSLIVDDVEDRSELRRGVPAVHKVFGEALAINAGTAAYLAFDRTARAVLADDLELQHRVHELYYDTLRAAHAGQALDITGHRHAMERALATGEWQPLEERILAVHRLKTAVPVRNLAEIGGILGSAGDQQRDALCRHFEAIGIAYQISDDVIDMRGATLGVASRRSDKPVKHTGDDIRNGKVTFPVARAGALLASEDMKTLWKVIDSQPSDPSTTQGCIDVLEECGALDHSVETAKRLVEESWQPLEALLEDSQSKTMLRAFGWYTVYRDCLDKG